jgi:hypothetical protein
MKKRAYVSTFCTVVGPKLCPISFRQSLADLLHGGLSARNLERSRWSANKQQRSSDEIDNDNTIAASSTSAKQRLWW